MSVSVNNGSYISIRFSEVLLYSIVQLYDIDFALSRLDSCILAKNFINRTSLFSKRAVSLLKTERGFCYNTDSLKYAVPRTEIKGIL